MLTVATPVGAALAQAKDFVQKTAFVPRPSFDAKKPYDAAQATAYFQNKNVISCNLGMDDIHLNINIWHTPTNSGGIDGIANVEQTKTGNGVSKAIVTGNGDKFFVDFLTGNFNISGLRIAVDRKTGKGVFGTREGEVRTVLDNCKIN